MMKKVAPLTGVLFFLLLLLSVLIGNNNLDASSTGAKVLAHYEAHGNSTKASGLLTVLAVVVGVIFYGQLRDYLRRHDGARGLAATAFGGAILFGASGGLSAGTQWALTDSTKHLSPDAAQALNLVQTDATYALELGGIAILLIAFGLAILNTALLPKWLGWVAFPIALVALIPPVGFVSFIGAGIWTLIVSVAMWRRLERADTVVVGAVAAGTST